MSYKVIARKCRPQTFDEVVGQGHVTRTLKNAIRLGRIAHSYLFTGERGVGKTSVARILAKALNCAEGPAEVPCGACPSCSEISAGTSLDLHEIDGASNNSVEDIRTLRENVKYRPTRDRYKIYIIDEVHMLTGSAFNALLKTLEEPPPHVIFIFATTEPRKLPETIVSRCLRFDFHRIPAADIARHLEAIAAREHVSASARSLELIAAEADGSMRDGQTILERAISWCGGTVSDDDVEALLGHIDRGQIFRVLAGIADKDAQECMQAVAELYGSGVDLCRFYYSLLEQARNMLMVQSLSEDSAPRVLSGTGEDAAQLKELAGRVSRDDLLGCVRMLLSAEADIIRSAQPKIALELCLLEIIYMQKALPVDDVLARIDSIHKRLPGNLSAAAPSRTQDVSEGSAPAAAPAAAKKSPPPGGSDDVGRRLFELLRKRHPPTAAKLSDVSVSEENGCTKVIWYATSFFAEQLKEPETLQKLQRVSREVVQHSADIAVEALSEKKNDEKKSERRPRQDKGYEHSALHNPLIQKVVETFEGQIVRITPYH